MKAVASRTQHWIVRLTSQFHLSPKRYTDQNTEHNRYKYKALKTNDASNYSNVCQVTEGLALHEKYGESIRMLQQKVGFGLPTSVLARCTVFNYVFSSHFGAFIRYWLYGKDEYGALSLLLSFPCPHSLIAAPGTAVLVVDARHYVSVAERLEHAFLMPEECRVALRTSASKRSAYDNVLLDALIHQIPFFRRLRVSCLSTVSFSHSTHRL